MATSLDFTARASVNWTYTNTLTEGNTSNANSISFSDTLANGTAADQADLLYIGSHTITASGTLNLDLAGSLTNVFGTTLTFARVKAVFITWQSDNTASGITVGNHATAAALLWFGAAAHTESVHKSGCLFHYRADATGWAVTAGTADMLKILNDDGANSAKIIVVVVGASA